MHTIYRKLIGLTINFLKREGKEFFFSIFYNFWNFFLWVFTQFFFGLFLRIKYFFLGQYFFFLVSGWIFLLIFLGGNFGKFPGFFLKNYFLGFSMYKVIFLSSSKKTDAVFSSVLLMHFFLLLLRITQFGPISAFPNYVNTESEDAWKREKLVV